MSRAPVPAKTKYTLWTHYCPLWKEGTHTGWKAIEPWPERKPVVGWYNEGTPEVADWHIKHMVEHGISGIVYCWYRSNLNGPVQQSIGHAIHDGLLKARYLPLIKFGIMWENGCGQGIGSAEDMMQNLLPFWIDNYFSNPSYVRIDGKPVLYVWVPSNVTRQLGGSEKVRQTFGQMRAQCRRRGLGGLYIVGCVGQADQAGLEAMAKEGWDASSAYGTSWRPPAHVTTLGDFYSAPFEGFIDQQEALWKFKRELHLLPDITAAMMGWDSRPWKETPFFWSDNTPQKFRELCRRAKAVMDSSPGSGPAEEHGDFLLLERVRRRPLHRADPGLRIFLSGRNPRGVLRGTAKACGHRPGRRGPRGRRFMVSRRPGIRSHPRSSDLAANRLVGRATGRMDQCHGTRSDPSSRRHIAGNVDQRRPGFFLTSLEAPRQPRCEGERRDAFEPADWPRSTFLVDGDGPATHRSRQRCGPDGGRRPLAPIHFRRGEESALGWMHHLAAVRSGHAERRDRGVEVGPP